MRARFASAVLTVHGGFAWPATGLVRHLQRSVDGNDRLSGEVPSNPVEDLVVGAEHALVDKVPPTVEGAGTGGIAG